MGKTRPAAQRAGGVLAGDRIMAVFRAPVALETTPFAPAWRRWVQDEAKRLAEEVRRWDGADLRLRIGLNSGR